MPAARTRPVDDARTAHRSGSSRAAWRRRAVATLVAVLGITLLALPVLPAGAASPPERPVLLTFQSADAARAAADQLDGAGLVTSRVVAVPLTVREQAAAASLPDLAAVELDGVVTGAELPAFDDPCMRAVEACLGVGSWYLESLGIDTLWAHSYGAGVTIAMIDGGIDQTHPELASALAGPEVDLTDAEPAPSHGTAVAGLALARAGNAVGIAGAAPEASLLSFRVLDGDRKGRVSDVASAVVQAADAGADVINLSLVGSSSAALESAIEHAHDRGVVVVAAAGNGASTEPSYPAALPGVVAVGATDSSGLVAPFSNHGDWVDAYVPGTTDAAVGLPAPDLSGGVRSFSGTSAAAPIVSGLVALLLAQNPSLGPADVEAMVRAAGSAVPAPRDFEGAGSGTEVPGPLEVPRLATDFRLVRDHPGNPRGSVDVVRLAPGGASVFGWALDRDSAESIDVHVYVDGQPTAITTALLPRPDVAAGDPARGELHGYGIDVPLRPGPHELCIYGINVGSGTNSLLGCEEVVAPSAPFGSIDELTIDESGLRGGGWAISPRTAAPARIDITVDGLTIETVTADRHRADVAEQHPSFGPRHGFVLDIPRERLVGQEVCVRAVATIATKLLGCRAI